MRFHQYDGNALFEVSPAAGSHPRFPSPERSLARLDQPSHRAVFLPYITQLAPWYDLSDGELHFGTRVAEYALDSQLLFSAIIALAAIHVANTTATTARAAAEFYHGCCIRCLIGIDDSALHILGGVALATTCLLRSYEILAGTSVLACSRATMIRLTSLQEEDPNRHLQGAYSLASQQHFRHDRPHDGLVATGFWNYLREDITFDLLHAVSPEDQPGSCPTADRGHLGPELPERDLPHPRPHCERHVRGADDNRAEVDRPLQPGPSLARQPAQAS